MILIVPSDISLKTLLKIRKTSKITLKSMNLFLVIIFLIYSTMIRLGGAFEEMDGSYDFDWLPASERITVLHLV